PTNLVPGGERGLEGREGATRDGVGGVLREEGRDEPVEDGGRPRRRRRIIRVLRGAAEAAERRELLGEAVEREEDVADGEALRGGRGGVFRVRLRRGGRRKLPPGLPGHPAGPARLAGGGL
uniref:Uncharacterized protein n=1 Tax=Oryza brachyantha TaxID=4533 RepID=J3MCT3_ORYBR